ncbi:hypothetical protein [Anaerotruncus colihominis]|jgi:hypothetical protein|uniref:Uncharacterized protein n=1 Tax=Anaerotruncus colihominis TaxID=169435 RepID=A0A845STD8_9FIRM|nr:hypothetical protein [Anaerotruncus colihominis]MCR2026050.1 hypothetical protein [Anaerotruncus colihominis]NDO37823.1 hypothetical protein [Anaerotruncus colihominis]
MKAENMIHPGFPLMKQGDIVSFYHLQMPRWLFTESKYMALSLEAKVACFPLKPLPAFPRGAADMMFYSLSGTLVGPLSPTCETNITLVRSCPAA